MITPHLGRPRRSELSRILGNGNSRRMMQGAVAKALAALFVLVAIEGNAAACDVNADCPATAPKCSGPGGTCLALCSNDTDCSRFSSQPHCELVNDTGRLGQCVACRSNNGSADCTSNTTPECTANVCVACSGAAGENACVNNHGGRHCEVNNTPASLQGTCVACRGERSLATTDCSYASPLCNATTDTCGPCDTSGNSECVKFGSNFVCATPPGGNGACVGCLSDSDCALPSAPHCVSMACVACDSTTATHGDESCTRFTDAGAPACQPADGIATFPGACRMCSKTNTAACTGSTPACYDVTGICQVCTAAEGDAGANVVGCADAGSGRACEGSGSGVFCGCSTNGDCDSTTVGSICEPTDHQCRACEADAGECPASTACAVSGPRAGHCVACVDDSTCTKPTVCDTAKNSCVGCLTNADCHNPTPKCDSETCAPCTDDSDCASSASGPTCAKSGAMAGQCVSPTTDAGEARDADADAASDGGDGGGAGAGSDSGCGCTVDDRSSGAAWGALAIFCIALGAARRRRPRAAR